MERTYGQLSLEERCTIARLHEAGQSCRQIAAAMDRSASTVSRELKRNRGVQVCYKAAYAAEQAWARRWRGSRLERQTELRDGVLERLAQGHSPEQVAGRLRLEQGRRVLSAESIYRFIYAQIRRTEDTGWRNYLPRRKYKRGYRRSRKDTSPMRLIPGRVSLSERPPEVMERAVGGHWEADLMLFSQPGHVVLVAQERASRLLIASHLNSKAATPIVEQLERNFAMLPPPLRQSITFDNGAEFSYHHRLYDSLNMKTFFCDKRAPWQKGGIETPSDDCAERCPEKLTPARSLNSRSTVSRADIITLQGNVSATKLQPKPSYLIWCTSNVNPHLRFAQDDGKNKNKNKGRRQKQIPFGDDN